MFISTLSMTRGVCAWLTSLPFLVTGQVLAGAARVSEAGASWPRLRRQSWPRSWPPQRARSPSPGHAEGARHHRPLRPGVFSRWVFRPAQWFLSLSSFVQLSLLKVIFRPAESSEGDFSSSWVPSRWVFRPANYSQGECFAQLSPLKVSVSSTWVPSSWVFRAV